MNNVALSRLENGLTVITQSMNWLATSSLGVWVDAGTRSESGAEHGFAHLLEHMAFKGTARRSPMQIAEEIEMTGGDLNAATGHESTAYYARMLKGCEETGFDILADILANPVFDPGELEREQNVVVQEIAATWDTPDDIVFDLFQEAAFGEQPLGRSILGTPETVRAATPEGLRGVLKSRYHGPNMVIVAVSSLAHDEILALVRERFAGFAATPRPVDPPARFLGGERHDQRDSEQVHLVAGFESVPLGHEDFFAEQVLATVLGGGMSSRLFQEVREKRGLCYHISGFHWGFRDAGIIGFAGATDAASADALLETSLDTIRDAGENLSDREVQKARAQIKAHLAAVMESPMSRAEQLARQYLVLGRLLPPEELLAMIDAVSLADVQRRLERLLGAGSAALAHVGAWASPPEPQALVARLRSGV